METFKLKTSTTAYIFWGMYVVGFCLMLYSKLNDPMQDTIYRIILSFIYWIGITIYLIFSLKSKKFVIFEDCIQFAGKKISFNEISKIEVEKEEIVVFNQTSQNLIHLYANQFQPNVWRRLSEKMKMTKNVNVQIY